MAVAKRSQTPSRQDACRELVSLLSRRYRSELPAPVERPVLETLLYGVCLEDTSPANATVALERLEAEFHDYNEARVSSILELERVFENTTAPEWKALRVRSGLTFVFESFYAYEFESLRRKNIDQAKRLLSRVPHLSLFPRVYTLNQALGSHLVPLDESMRDTGVWLGLGSRGHSPQRAGNVLKSGIRKDDVEKFCELLRCLANDERVKAELEMPDAGVAPDFGLDTMLERVRRVFQPGRSRQRKSIVEVEKKPAKKKAVKKKAVKKKAVKKKAASKPARKSVSKKTTAAGKSARKKTSTGSGTKKKAR